MRPLASARTRTARAGRRRRTDRARRSGPSRARKVFASSFFLRVVVALGFRAGAFGAFVAGGVPTRPPQRRARGACSARRPRPRKRGRRAGTSTFWRRADLRAVSRATPAGFSGAVEPGATVNINVAVHPAADAAASSTVSAFLRASFAILNASATHAVREVREVRAGGPSPSPEAPKVGVGGAIAKTGRRRPRRRLRREEGLRKRSVGGATAPSRSSRAATKPRRASSTRTVPSTNRARTARPRRPETAADAVTGNGVVQSHAGVEYAADAASAASAATPPPPRRRREARARRLAVLIVRRRLRRRIALAAERGNGRRVCARSHRERRPARRAWRTSRRRLHLGPGREKRRRARRRLGRKYTSGAPARKSGGDVEFSFSFSSPRLRAARLLRGAGVFLARAGPPSRMISSPRRRSRHPRPGSTRGASGNAAPNCVGDAAASHRGGRRRRELDPRPRLRLGDTERRRSFFASE